MIKYLLILLLIVLPSFANGATDGTEVQLLVEGTPVVPPSPPASGGGAHTTVRFFSNFTINPAPTSALLTWQSTVPVIATVTWGRTPDTKDGIIRTILFSQNMSITINNLSSDTKYYVSVEGQDIIGRSTSLLDQTFTTLFLPDLTAPINPGQFRAANTKQGVVLTWQNPSDEDFEYVRVMRSLLRYTASPYVGTLVYEGGGQYATDSSVREGKKYFYTIFARDEVGNFSSGAATSIVYSVPTVTIPKETVPPVLPTIPTQPVIPIVPDVLPKTDYKITITQNGKELNSGMLTIIPNEPIFISVQVPAGSPAQKEMRAQVLIPATGEIQTYLFTYNSQTNTYHASIPPVIEGKGYTLDIFSSDQAVPLQSNSVTVPNRIDDRIPNTPSQDQKRKFGDDPIKEVIAVAILVFCLLLVGVIDRKRQKRENS